MGKVTIALIGWVALPMILLSCMPISDENRLRMTIERETRLLGDSNWIILTDSAFPVPAKKSLKVLQSPDTIAETFLLVQGLLHRTGHVQMKLYKLLEVDAVEEYQVPEVTSYRKEIKKALEDQEVITLLNDTMEILYKEVLKKRRILLIKTVTSVPYASVFIQLKNGYWDNETEDNLRAKFKNTKP